jgi:hypothetical protein
LLLTAQLPDLIAELLVVEELMREPLLELAELLRRFLSADGCAGALA